MKTRISIREAQLGDERDRAIEYVSAHMHKTHGSCPPRETTPPHLFIALDGETIVGSLGMLFGEKDTPLPIERFFKFAPEAVPVPYVRERTVYYSRWNSSRHGIGPAIWLAASNYALRHGMHYTAQTIKDAMLARYRAFGCIWYPIPDAEIRMENIGESERAYFADTSQPHPWVGILPEQLRDLPAIVRRITEDTGMYFEM